MTNYILENELKNDLLNNEQLLWVGKPRTGINFRSSDVFFIPFSLIWTGFILFWERDVIAMGNPFMILWGIPMLAMGFYITIGRFIADAVRRKNTTLGITGERILVKTGVFKISTTASTIKNLRTIRLQQNSNGTGTITFDGGNVRHYWAEGLDWLGTNQPSRFDNIENVKEVYNTIQQLQHGKMAA